MSSHTRIAALWIAVALAACTATHALAAVPGQVNYQGLLLDAQGDPVTVNVDLSFSLFDVATGGVALWTEPHPAVPVLDGVYDVVLGSTTPITASLVAGGSVFLEIRVGAETLTPRQQLVAVPYAVRAGTAEDVSAIGGVSSTFVTQLFQHLPFDGSAPANDDPREGFADADGDGIANFLDPDNDDDGIGDGDELSGGTDINLVTPVLTEFVPTSADASSTSTVTVTGANFDPAMSVVFGGETPTPLNTTSTSFQVQVGPQPAGATSVTVTLPNGELATAGFSFSENPSGITGSTSAECGAGSGLSVVSCDIAYPAGITAGDELLIWLGIDGDPSDIACTNFEHLTEAGDTVSLAVLRRTATGPHTGFETCTWNVGEPQAGGVIMTRVPAGARLRPPLAVIEPAATSSDPSAIPIPSADALVITACSHDGSGNVSDPPTGYIEVLDGIGCDSGGCANISLATRVVSTTGSEDPGPFTNWTQSEESACITLAYDDSSNLEPIFAVNWDSTSTPESCFAEGATTDTGAGDCNCATGNCPLPQGGESLALPAQTVSQNTTVGFSSPNGSMSGVSQGCLVMDFELNFDAFSTTKNTSFLELKSADLVSGGEIRYLNSGDVLGVRCGDDTLGSFTFAPTVDTDYRVRFEYCIDAGPGSCTGNTPGCTDCGCLYLETAVGGNPYGTTQVDRCEGSSGTPFVPINGWQLSMAADTLDLIVDDVAICDASPPAGAKCGE